jgi:hypothetical protein
MRKNSVVISIADIKAQQVVPVAIPGVTKRTEPLNNNGKGRENLLRVLTQQVNVNREEKEFKQKIEKEITKESVIQQERQDKIVKVFFKKESPLIATKPPLKIKKPKACSEKLPVERGNLSYFLEKTNFTEPQCLIKEKEREREKKNQRPGSSKYDAIDTRLNTTYSRPSSAPAPAPVRSSFLTSSNSYLDNSSPPSKADPSPPSAVPCLHTRMRVPPGKRGIRKNVTTPETNSSLLPYPEDIGKSDSRLHFSDVWKKVETKDVFPHVNRSVGK